ncbi:peptide ABC transporter permease [Sorangium cellulosum]|uniref:Oligopeptide transport system permease protein OppC n=1 Tax=Sorangium cellulosum TaxID=56 RepID=A0A4P2Q134_SORCE|nr:ABC transporter permease subunit [Sorangium cellulosum]AUX22648.1 peptide ABC transporter permease [Sorangium cellulosum]
MSSVAPSPRAADPGGPPAEVDPAAGGAGPRPPAPLRLDAIEQGSSLGRDAWRRLRKNRAAVASGAVLVAMIVACVLVPELSSYRYDAADLKLGAQPPSLAHWMGTDYFGRDLMARVFFGGRISFAVGIVATLVSFVIGVSWGGVAGYFGGKIDAIMMRVVDVLYTFPFLILVILLMVFFANDQTVLYRAFQAALGLMVEDPSDPSYFPIFQIVVVFAALGGISWLTMARIVRGQVIALRNQPFIESARSIGVGHAALIFRHLVPNALGPIIVYTTLTIPEVMMTEAFLSFLGLGTQEPLSSWGLLASTGADAMDLFPWQLIFPALMLALTLICFNFLGDGLRDALDPRIRKD